MSQQKIGQITIVDRLRIRVRTAADNMQIPIIINHMKYTCCCLQCLAAKCR